MTEQRWRRLSVPARLEAATAPAFLLALAMSIFGASRGNAATECAAGPVAFKVSLLENDRVKITSLNRGKHPGDICAIRLFEIAFNDRKDEGGCVFHPNDLYVGRLNERHFHPHTEKLITDALHIPLIPWFELGDNIVVVPSDCGELLHIRVNESEYDLQ